MRGDGEGRVCLCTGYCSDLRCASPNSMMVATTPRDEGSRLYLRTLQISRCMQGTNKHQVVITNGELLGSPFSVVSSAVCVAVGAASVELRC